MDGEKEKQAEILEAEIEITEKEISSDSELEKEETGTETSEGEGETKDSAEWGDLAEEAGLERDADPRVILKELVELRQGRPKLEILKELEQEVVRLGYADLDHFIEKAKGYDPARREPGERGGDTAEKKQAGDFFKKYDPEGKHGDFYRDWAAHLTSEWEGKFNQTQEAFGRLVENTLFLELKDTLREQGKKLDVSKGRLIKIADDYNLFAKAAKQNANALELAYRIYLTEGSQKPPISANGKTGIDEAKRGEKPGAQKTAQERIPLTADGEPDWEKMRQTPAGLEQMHRLVAKMPHR